MRQLEVGGRKNLPDFRCVLHTLIAPAQGPLSTCLGSRPAPVQDQAEQDRGDGADHQLQLKAEFVAESPGGTSETRIPISTTRNPRPPQIHTPAIPPGTSTA